MDLVRYTVATGKVLWTAEVIVQSEQRHLIVNSWTRRVEVDGETDGYIRLVKEKGMPGDYTESNLFDRDEQMRTGNPELFLLLIQRILITEEPFIAAHRCLVIQHVEDDRFRRVGICLWRFSHPRHDPFPNATLPLENDHVVLI